MPGKLTRNTEQKSKNQVEKIQIVYIVSIFVQVLCGRKKAQKTQKLKFRVFNIN